MTSYVVAEYCEKLSIPPEATDDFFYIRENPDEPPAVAWTYGRPEFYYLVGWAKHLGAVWENPWWEFPNQECYEEFFRFPGKKRHLSTCLRIARGKEYTGLSFTLFQSGVGCYFFPRTLRLARDFGEHYWLSEKNLRKWWKNAPIVYRDTEYLQELLEDKGAAVKLVYPTPHPVTIEVDRWLVHIHCSPDEEPSHFLLRSEAGPLWYWRGRYPNGIRTAIAWDGDIVTTRQEWKTKWCELLEKYDIPWEGDDPEKVSLHAGLEFDFSSIPGWDSPAPNGHTLHQFQKKGVEFVASTGGRALLGDEMGIGKTAQALAATVGMGIKRGLVVVPSNARYVWEREIRGWIGEGQKIQHIMAGDDVIDSSSQWVIVTYDLLITRARRISVTKFRDKKIIDKALRAAGIKKLDWKKKKNGKNKTEWSISVSHPVEATDLSPDVQEKWDAMITRLRDSMLEKVITWAPDLAIYDEAHRVNNINSKRTKVVLELANNTRYLLVLSGTPIRNHACEAATLLSLLDKHARDQLGVMEDMQIGLSSRREVNERLVKEFLSFLMIRRTKKQVLPQLPPKIREWIEVVPDSKHPNVKKALFEYNSGIDVAEYAYYKSLEAGKSEGEARNAMRGGIACARVAMGKMKVADGQIKEMISSVVQQKGCCIVFSSHHAVTDLLAEQLTQAGNSVVVVDGRTRQADRKEAERAFQSGDVDVFLGGIKAAGESITLTRSDTCVFVESDWVPAAMMQAEDRGHRIGQEGNGYHIIHTVLSIETGITLDQDIKTVLEAKTKIVDRILDESTDFTFTNPELQGSIESSVIKIMLRRKNKKPIQ